MRVRIFDVRGEAVAEVVPSVESVVWRLNGVGSTKLTLPYTDPKCTKRNFTPGNRVLMEFENGLPAWGGVIDTPFRQNEIGLTVTAYSGEALLGWRVCRQTYRSVASPGAIYRELIQQENADYPMGVTGRHIFDGGTPLDMEYHYYDLLRRSQTLHKDSGQDFSVEPELVAGRLSFAAYWYQRRGRDLSHAVALVHRRNVSNPILDQQGQIAGRVIIASGAGDWETRLVAIAEDSNSLTQYGYREYSEIASLADNQQTLDQIAAQRLSEKAAPRQMISLEALDLAPGRFTDYNLGDTVHAELFMDAGEWSFVGKLRIIAREYNPTTSRMRLEVEVVG